MAIWGRPVLALAILMGGCSLPESGSTETLIKKTFSYFSISGKTPEDLDRELMKRGPLARSTGMRHPGVTRIKFGGTVTYVESNGRCSIGEAKVTLTTNIVLPRWKNRARASKDMALIWDTLSADIKRHEERHAEIARNHARGLERSLLALPTAGNCNTLKDRVAILSEQAVEKHNEDQQRFDRIEAINFENRMIRLLHNRMATQN